MRQSAVMKKIVFICCALLICISASERCSWPWWFNQSDEELLQKALKSTNPRTIEKCLDKLIQRENYAGVLQIKNHVQEMLRAERNKLLEKRIFDQQQTKKCLAPWVKLEQKANQFFKRTNVNQQGKDLSVP